LVGWSGGVAAKKAACILAVQPVQLAPWEWCLINEVKINEKL